MCPLLWVETSSARLRKAQTQQAGQQGWTGPDWPAPTPPSVALEGASLPSVFETQIPQSLPQRQPLCEFGMSGKHAPRTRRTQVLPILSPPCPPPPRPARPGAHLYHSSLPTLHAPSTVDGITSTQLGILAW